MSAMAIAISTKLPTTDAMKTGRSSGWRSADSSMGGWFRVTFSPLAYKNGNAASRTTP